MISIFKGLAKLLVLLGFNLILLVSCKSKDAILLHEIDRSVSEDDLIERVLVNELSFSTLYFRRLDVDLNQDGKSRSVRANMFINRDSLIVISVIPFMGIEVFRIGLDQDSIRIIDRINRKMFVSDYNFLSNFFFIDVSYQIVESLLTNALFSYPVHDPLLLKNYSLTREPDFYSLRSVNTRRFDRISRRRADVMLHEVEILPEFFKVLNSKIVNASTGLSINVQYQNFAALEAYYFPRRIIFNAKQGDKVYNLTLNFSDIAINGSNTLNFRLPSNYEITSF